MDGPIGGRRVDARDDVAMKAMLNEITLKLIYTGLLNAYYGPPVVFETLRHEACLGNILKTPVLASANILRV